MVRFLIGDHTIAQPHFLFPSLPGARQMEHWSLGDPAAIQGTYDEILLTFGEPRNEIEKRIQEKILKS